jgi:hypothetical protein
VALPRESRDFGSTGGELPPDAFRFSLADAELLVPVPPGSRQVVLSYTIPSGSVDVPVGDATSMLEVLLEGGGGGGGGVTGAGLTAEEPVSMEGRTFQRFTASSVRPGTTFEIGGAGDGSSQRVALLAVVAAAVALGIFYGRRLSSSAPVPAAAIVARTPADAIAREIAALDNVYANSQGPAHDYYRSRREALLEKLVAQSE